MHFFVFFYSTTVLQDVAAYLKLLPPPDNSDNDIKDKNLLMELLVKKQKQLEGLLKEVHHTVFYYRFPVMRDEHLSWKLSTKCRYIPQKILSGTKMSYRLNTFRVKDV